MVSSNYNRFIYGCMGHIDIFAAWIQPETRSFLVGTGWGPKKIAKLPYKWLNSMVYGRYNELVFMGFVKQLIHITFGVTILYKVGPPNDSVQLVQITPITMIYATYNYSIHGLYKPSFHHWGAPSCNPPFLVGQFLTSALHLMTLQTLQSASATPRKISKRQTGWTAGSGFNGNIW